MSKVGVAGFEPAASCSQSRRDNRATLHPECGYTFAERQGLEPWQHFRVDRLAICCITTLPSLLSKLHKLPNCGCKYTSLFHFTKTKKRYFLLYLYYNSPKYFISLIHIILSYYLVFLNLNFALIDK